MVMRDDSENDGFCCIRKNHETKALYNPHPQILSHWKCIQTTLIIVGDFN